MTAKNYVATALISLTLLFVGSTAQAAVITWGSVYDAVDSSDVYNGSVGPFKSFVDSSTFWTSDLTINGVTFNHYDHKHYPGSSGGAPFSYGFANSNITIDADSTYYPYGGPSGEYSAAPVNDYDRLTTMASYSNSSKYYAITLSGLTVGRQYQVQLFGPDWNVTFHRFRYGDGLGHYTDTMHTGGYLQNNSGPPQYVFGTFVAGAESQQIFMGGDTSYSYGMGPAVSLFTVPEPTTMIIWSLLGGLAVMLGRRKWRKAA
jgi:hypothetical protein